MTAEPDPPLLSDLMRLKPDDLTPNGWAVRAGVSRTVWSDMRRHGNPSRRTLEKLLSAAGSSLAEFEALRIGERPAIEVGRDRAGVDDAGGVAWRGQAIPPIPLFATTLEGFYGESVSQVEQVAIRFGDSIGQIARPAAVAGDPRAYGVTMAGSAMWPRFRMGRQLIVSPRAPLAAGDDVVVRLAGRPGDSSPALALIKELTQQTVDFVELRQFNPDLRFRVDAGSVASIHKIIGEAY